MGPLHPLPHTRTPTVRFKTAAEAARYVARELDKLIRARNAAGKPTVLGLATATPRSRSPRTSSESRRTPRAMKRPPADTCLHTILHPDRLAQAAALRGPTTFVVGQRMMTAASLFREAAAAGRDVAVVFGDATDCSRLVYWGLMTAIDVGDSDTHYTVSRFVG